MRNEKGFTLVELMTVVAISGTLMAVAIPRLVRAKTASSEASAIGSLRAVNSGQFTFAASCGLGFYAPTLAILSTAPALGGGGFVGPDLSSDPSVKSTYEVALTPGTVVGTAAASCNGAAPGSLVSSYFASANPVSGQGKFFGSNRNSTIYQSTSAIAVTYTGAPVGATPVG